MRTVALLIGNSDNKLTQEKWSEFIGEIDRIVRMNCFVRHFKGFSAPDSIWQNACWVAEISVDQFDFFRSELSKAATVYNQDSIALMVGGTEFVSGK